jgi:hypothetical protein
LLNKFPTTEIAARTISVTNWKESMFVSQQEGGNTYVTVPKNIESFMDSLFMISLLKLFEKMRWIPVVSEKDLAPAVLETREGAFFAGFIAASLREEIGPMDTGTSKYAKGVRAFQTYSVEKVRGKSIHLRTGGMDKLTERLSNMKGFTREYWGLRGTLAALFKSVPHGKVTDLGTYFQSKTEIMKNIKTRLAYKNGGVFRPEELICLEQRYRATQTALDSFLARLDNPNEELALYFSDIYSSIRSRVETADNEVRPIMTARARILFPQDKRKKSITWAKKSLQEKLLDLDDEKLVHFLPETLPGIAASGTTQAERGSTQFLRARCSAYGDNQDVMAVITSWYSEYDSSVQGE